MIELLRLFGKELEGYETLSFERLNKISLIRGYFVKPKACTLDTLNYLETIQLNPNATFYKDWDDIINKDRFELLIDQLLHYESTYGTNFESEPYIPNDGNIQLPEMKNIKTIDVISKEEAKNLLLSMAYSPMAMKQETLNDIFSLLDKLAIDIDISLIKNKELKMMWYSHIGQTPSDMEEFVRFLIYKATGKTLLIKSKAVIEELKASTLELNKYITKDNIAKVSSVFYRYKPIFLAFKKDTNKKIINRLRKLAVKNHKPKIQSFWSNCFDKPLVDILNRLGELNNFKKISIIQECLIRDNVKDLSYKPYIIRNGKVYLKEYNNNSQNNKYQEIAEILYWSMIEDLKKKKCKININKDIRLALPSSEKSFIGDYPLYSSVKIDNNTIIGIYWRGEWGARDLDLSFIDAKTSEKIGWNQDFYNSDIIFSGDMTYANPEATELLYFKKGFSGNGIIHVNNYSGENNSEYNLLVAKEPICKENFHKGYMCNHDNIILQAHDKMDSKEKSIAISADGRLYLALLRTGNKCVSNGNNITTEYAQYILKTIKNRLMLEDVLKDAGFTFVDNAEDADIDFSKPTKDMFINLLN